MDTTAGRRAPRRRLPLLGVAAAVALGCAPRARSTGVRPATIDVRPVPSGSALVVGAPLPTCTLEGDGEPEDRLMFHEPEDLLVFGGRADAEPLVRIEGRGRHTLHGHWTELAPEDGDGRARLLLESPGSYRIAGFSLLHATRFRLRRRSAVIEGHVWLEPDFVVRIAGVHGARARVVAAVPFDAPKELSLEVGCSDLAYDDRREREPDPAPPGAGAQAHVGRVALHDEPGGAPVFEGGPQLFFVTVDEERAGFARIHGERHGIRIAGWTPRELVSHAPQGSGEPGGSRSFRSAASKGKAARATRTAPLLADRAGKRVVIGQVERGARLGVLQSGTDGMVTVELAGPEVRAVPGVVLMLSEADVERF